MSTAKIINRFIVNTSSLLLAHQSEIEQAGLMGLGKGLAGINHRLVFYFSQLGSLVLITGLTGQILR